MPFIGYTHRFKYNKIITIKVLDDEQYVYSDDISEDNKLYGAYYTDNYEIIQVEDVDGNIYDGNICDGKVELRREICYFLTKEIPINRINYNIFFKDRNKLGKEFTGIQKDWYDSGQLMKEFFHINGKIYGEYKFYHDNGQLMTECVYVDGKKNGEYKVYDEDGNLEKIDYYVAGEKV